MSWMRRFRAATVAAALIAVVTCAGCSGLNSWSGPSQDPFFSVDDAPGRNEPIVQAGVQAD